MNKRRTIISVLFITILLILISGGVVFQNIWFSKNKIPAETSYSELSPNKKWGILYDNHTQDGESINTIKIFSLDGKTEYRLDDSKLQNYSNCIGFNTMFWSSDSKFLYFEPWTCQHTTRIFSGMSPVLYSVELDSGNFTETLPIILSKNLTDQNFYEYAFSSDGNFLAYIQPDLPAKLFVKNMITGEATQFHFNSQFQEAGCIGWAFDEHIFSFSAATTSTPRSKTTSSLFSVNMNTREIHEMKAPQNVIYCAWLDQSNTQKGLIKVAKIELEKYYNWCDGCVDLLFNPLTGKFSPVK